MNPVTRNRVIGLAIAVLAFAVDQGLKGFVLHGLKLAQGQSYYLLPFFQFTLTFNDGVSLGLFSAQTPTMRWVLVAVTGAIALMVTVWMLRERKMIDIAALALILGGALGNIKDRFDEGRVVDYLDLHFGDWRPFLIFNFADALITVGVIIILARSLLIREKAPDQSAEAAAEF